MRRRRRVERLGQAEVEHLDRPVRPQLDVGRLQVAMDDAVLVGGFDRFDDLSRDWQCFVERKRTLGDAVGERRAMDELEHQRVCPPLLESVDRADVGMVERREQVRFALESRDAVGIGGEGTRKDLERYVAVEPGIARAITSPMPPAPRSDTSRRSPRLGRSGLRVRASLE